jgi:hypothetical protein
MTDLSVEIRELEKNLHALDSTSIESQKILNESERLEKSVVRRINAKHCLMSNKENAEKHQKNYAPLRGLSRISLTILDPTEFSVVLSCTFGSILTTFKICEGSSIRCISEVKEYYLIQSGRREVLSVNAERFLKSRFPMIAHKVCEEKIKRTDEISRIVREVEWSLSRIESTAREISALENRYEINLCPSHHSKEDLQLIVFFRKNPSFSASFEVDGSYPFGKLNVSIDPGSSQVSLDSVKRHLIKNAKPGFGYLSRTCDILATAHDKL